MSNYYNHNNMNFFETVRNKVFFLLDRFKNNRIKETLTDLENFDNAPNRAELQKAKLDKLIECSVTSTPFYKDYQDKRFDSFPVITKEFLSQNKEDFHSSNYKTKDLIKVSTSGSYGTPMSFYRSKRKQLFQMVDVIYYGSYIGYYVGRKHAFIRGISKSKLKLLLQNEIHIDPTNLDDKSLGIMRKKVKKSKFIIGFPSVIISLVQYCENIGDTADDFNILGITTSAEPLSEEQRTLIQNFFRCSVVSRYAMEELGIIANQCLHTESYHVNDASFIVEVLKKDKDQPVEPGKEGRIIVTDLHSHAMPLIRYDTGDFGIINESCSCGYTGKVLKTISGRKIETLYTTDGDKLSPFSLNVRMKDIENVYQFQFIQENEQEYQMLLVVNEKFGNKQEILKILHNLLGSDANITLKIVNEIEPLPSGKRPYIINRLNKPKDS